MDEVLRHVETALRCHPAPAVRLSELLTVVRSRTSGRILDIHLLRQLIERHPGHFRILDPWRGPWRTARPQQAPETPDEDPWVLVVTDPADQDLDAPRVAKRLRESVRWLARTVDPRSTHDIVRWHALALEERHLRARVLDRAA